MADQWWIDGGLVVERWSGGGAVVERCCDVMPYGGIIGWLHVCCTTLDDELRAPRLLCPHEAITTFNALSYTGQNTTMALP